MITPSNAGKVVETLRALGELMIWGDQNADAGATGSSFFDFFAEKNLLSHFVRILQQRCENRVKVQVIQTLSILFQNLSNEVSIFYLLSNNYIKYGTLGATGRESVRPSVCPSVLRASSLC